MNPRSSGLLLHLTSLPGREGCGTMGGEARRWIDFLHETGQQLWQILPLCPPHHGNCPYLAFSAFAGNPLLIDLRTLEEEGFLPAGELACVPRFDIRQVEFEKAKAWKTGLLRKAYRRFTSVPPQGSEEAYGRFLKENSWWLDDYAIFMAARDHFGGIKWQEWPRPLKSREPGALDSLCSLLSEETGFHRFVQFCFFRQWDSLRGYAASKNVRIIGDIPLYVAGDSADVWANPGIFRLDGELNPLQVAGVPPDYFSASGQLWGSPVYDWDNLQKQEYHWWIARIHFNLRMFDQVRIDHFRGLEAFWSVPAGEETAIHGEWAAARGYQMLDLLRRQLGNFPMIAEDLGTITPEVEQLRDTFNLPGMKVLQFAFTSDEKNLHLPHNYLVNTVVYTGTHDNDTAWGWLHAAGEQEKKRALSYLKNYHWQPVWGLMEMAWASVACKAVAPLQDLLELGAEARMNIPGVATGNWAWRFRWNQLRGRHRRFLREITRKYNRTPD